MHLKIIEADTEKDNIKAANGNDRRFLLHGDKPVAEESGSVEQDISPFGIFLGSLVSASLEGKQLLPSPTT